jgi:hypothetical protein
MEIWKPVASTKNLIEVSSLGRARRVERPLVYSDGRQGTLPAAMLRLTVQSTGYPSVSFSGKHLLVHRLVAEAFLPPASETFASKTINHKNGIKTDNRPENLEYATYQQNNKHARRTGLNKQHGENTNLSKYSDRFINAVRNVYAEYQPTYNKLGRMFGITGCHARQIVLNLTRAKPTV